MRFLKQKIARSLQLHGKVAQPPQNKQQHAPSLPLDLTPSTVFSANEQQTPSSPVKKSRRIATSPSIPRGSTSSKNIMKNYCRALVSFAASSVATPYLVPLLKEHDISIKEFQGYFSSKKDEIHCINRLREMLLVEAGDSQQMAAIKTVFREISIVFLKCFSVNWVFSSRVCDKISHLNYRQRILRRVKNPLHFTYLQEFVKKETKRSQSTKNRLGY